MTTASPYSASPIQSASDRLKRAIVDASRGLIERERLVELVVLAAVAGEHLLVIGPPGTAKSAAVRGISQRLGGAYFEYLLGRFTEPSELFGPVDISKLRDGRVEVRTAGMLPEAEIAFLDEVFLGSTAILNALLTLLNERTFRRGHSAMNCPLRVCVGASNHMPSDDGLAAFADRFLIHVFVEPTGDTALEDLLDAGWLAGTTPISRGEDLDSVDILNTAMTTASVLGVRDLIAQAVRTLRAAGIELTDRRIVKLQRLVMAAALLDGRSEPSAQDLWPMIYAVPSRAGQDTARNALRDLLDSGRNGALPHAAEDATRGRAARADRLIEAGKVLLSEVVEEARRGTWLLELEGVAREIDASFGASELPEGLREVRDMIGKKLDVD